MNDHPNPPGPDLESQLRSTLRAEADRVETDAAALALIRQRTAAAKPATGFAGWFFRPAVAGGTLAFTLVLGTLIGVNMASNNGSDNVIAEPAASALAVAPPAAQAEAQADDSSARSMSKAAPEAEAMNDSATTQLVPTPESPVTPYRTELGEGGGPEEPTPVHKMPVDDGGSYVAITAPDSGILVERTFELRGLARAFEANVIIEVSQNGKVVKRDFATASAGAPEKGEWTKKLTLEPGNYRIEVFEESMEGNGEKLASDTIWLTVVGTTSGGSEPSSEGPADPVAVPAESGESGDEPAVDPAVSSTDGATS